VPLLPQRGVAACNETTQQPTQCNIEQLVTNENPSVEHQALRLITWLPPKHHVQAGAPPPTEGVAACNENNTTTNTVQYPTTCYQSL